MIIAQHTILIFWAILLIYWFASWRKVKTTQTTKINFKSIRWLAVWAVIIVFILTKADSQLPFSHVTCTRAFSLCSVVAYIAILLALCGATTAIAARRTLSTNWSSNIDIKKDHELITTGVYSYIRHPIYTEYLLMGLASIIAYQTLAPLIVFVFACCFLVFKLKNEEELLTEHFPKEYPAYKKHVKALIPFVI